VNLLYDLSAVVTVSARTQVWAASLEDAIQIAKGREVVIGGPNSGAIEEEEWIIDDADGEATDIKEA
jgi:hypothetical protein